MAMREDDQIAFADLHWPVNSFDGEPARSCCDDVEALHLPLRHTETPGGAHVRPAIERLAQVDELEQVGKDIFLKMRQRLYDISFLFWMIGKES